MKPSPFSVSLAYSKDAGAADLLKWIVQPWHVLKKHHRKFVSGPLDDAADAILKDLAPELVKAIVEQEIDEDVDEYLAGAQEGRFEALQGWYADAESNQSQDYYAGYDWGFANAQDWDGRDLPSAVKRKVVQEQIKEFRGEITEQVVIAALEGAWSAVSPREIFITVMRAVKQHGWKVGLVYAVGEVIENLVIPAALSSITGVPWPPGSLAWLPLNDVVFAAIVKRLGRSDSVDDFQEDGHLDWYEAQFGAVRIARYAAQKFQWTRSPLTYNVSGNAKRLGLIDSEAGEPDERETYFAETQKELRKKNYQRYKKPRYETIPGAEPGTVAFLDYHEFPDYYGDGKTYLYLDYVSTRNDRLGQGHARKLFEGLLGKYGKDSHYDFGRIAHKAVYKIFRTWQSKGVNVRGNNWGGFTDEDVGLSSRVAARYMAQRGF